MIVRAAWKAMLERRQRLGLALAALTVAATLATALLSLYSDLERKLRGEFQGYGANLIVAPAGDAETLPLALLPEVERWGAAAPFLYRIETVEKEPVVVAAVDFGRLGPLAAYWDVRGRRDAGPGECLAGERAAQTFRLAPGSEITVGERKLRVTGIVSTGGPEDSQIIVPLEGSQAASLIALRTDGSRVEEARRSLAAALPQAEVRVLRAVVESEAAVILKVRGTLFLLTTLVLGISMLCVVNNFGAVIYQRSREIGVLKAIGGGDFRVAGLFAAEAVGLGVAGSLIGFAAGAALARWIGWQIFRQPAAVRPETLAVVAGVTLALAVTGTAIPLRRIRRMEPAVILRGE